MFILILSYILAVYILGYAYTMGMCVYRLIFDSRVEFGGFPIPRLILWILVSFVYFAVASLLWPVYVVTLRKSQRLN